MKNMKSLFGASLVSGAMVALSVACGSSKSSPEPMDSGSADSGDSGAIVVVVGSGCSPLGGSAGCGVGQGLACSIDTSNTANLLSAFSAGGNLGMCEPASSCTTNICLSCIVPSDCSTSQVCCGGIAGDAAALAAELAEAGISADASLDATALAAGDAGAGGFSSIMATTTCQTSCTAGQYKLCSTNADCMSDPINNTCGMPNAAALGGGGASAFISIMVCEPADAGAPPVTDSGTGGTTDSGSAADGGTGG